METNNKVEGVRESAHNLSFKCEIFYHEQSGKSTEDAMRATGLDSNQIIKCLLLRSRNDEYLGAIVRGSDKLDFKALENVSGYKDLRMAQPADIERRLGFEVGGVPAIIFFEKKIRTFVDNKVLSLDYVVGSGGSQFHGMRFNPEQLVKVLNYTPVNISK